MIRIVERKLCPICNEWFSRPSGKSNKVWAEQKCCGSNCAAVSRRVAKPQRPRRVDLIPGGKRYEGWVKRK